MIKAFSICFKNFERNKAHEPLCAKILIGLTSLTELYFIRYTPDEHGGWLMDPAPRDPEDFHKIWTTSGSIDLMERKVLYEFADEDKYRQGNNNFFAFVHRNIKR